MKFTVIWQPSAEQELAQLWEDAADRRDITMASDAIVGLQRQHPCLVVLYSSGGTNAAKVNTGRPQ